MKKIFLWATICFLLLVILSSCDNDIVIVRYDFVQYPRLVYIANIDAELDFTGATLIPTARNGDQGQEFLVAYSSWIVVEHSIDFTIPGVYKVELTVDHTHRQFLVPFYVQVIE